jgi:hypothetical protein
MRNVLVFAVVLLLLGCGGPDPAEQADQLERELETVLDGGEAGFGHIEIEEGSEAAVIRGLIASLELKVQLAEAGGLEGPMDSAEADYTVAALVEGQSIPDKDVWIEERYQEYAQEEIEDEADDIRVRIIRLRDE